MTFDDCKHTPKVGGVERAASSKEVGMTRDGDFMVVQWSNLRSGHQAERPIIRVMEYHSDDR